jgi:hypothetical protein
MTKKIDPPPVSDADLAEMKARAKQAGPTDLRVNSAALAAIIAELEALRGKGTP